MIEPLIAKLPDESPLSAEATAELVIESAAQMAGEQPDLLIVDRVAGTRR